MKVGVLERLDQTEDLVNRTSNRKIIDRYLTNNALAVDNEQTPAA